MNNWYTSYKSVDKKLKITDPLSESVFVLYVSNIACVRTGDRLLTPVSLEKAKPAKWNYFVKIELHSGSDIFLNYDNPEERDDIVDYFFNINTDKEKKDEQK